MKEYRWQWALVPALVMATMIWVILLAHQGIPAKERPSLLAYLEKDGLKGETSTSFSTVILYDSSEKALLPVMNTVEDTLKILRIPFQKVDIVENKTFLMGNTEHLLVCMQDLTVLAMQADGLTEWINHGGRMAILLTPLQNEAFTVLYRKLGISEYAKSGAVDYTSYTQAGPLTIFSGKDKVYTADGTFHDLVLPVQLEEGCTLHMHTGDEKKRPLLWSRDEGTGRVVVNFNGLIQGKDSRGQVLHVLFALYDSLVYPIVNASMVCVQDLIGPQPLGRDERLTKEYGYDMRGFYRNRLWPDLKKLTAKYGVRYTGTILESYDTQASPPFSRENTDSSLMRYYAMEMLQSGGEVALCGYHPAPLCLAKDFARNEEETIWRSESEMRSALEEVVDYAGSFLPPGTIKCYVPPENMLSRSGKRILLETLTTVRVLSGSYLPFSNRNALVQEYCEEEDGIISVPRITSGFYLDQYSRQAADQALLLYGVFAHTISPSEVRGRGDDLGWKDLYGKFEDLLRSIHQRFAFLRWFTFSEGAAAVQRYDRLNISRENTPEGLTIRLWPFYDSAWMALKSECLIESVENATLFPVSVGFYWLRANADTVYIKWRTVE